MAATAICHHTLAAFKAQRRVLAIAPIEVGRRVTPVAARLQHQIEIHGCALKERKTEPGLALSSVSFILLVVQKEQKPTLTALLEIGSEEFCKEQGPLD